jgi:RNA polymerase sigma factor (sigma-70 family)
MTRRMTPAQRRLAADYWGWALSVFYNKPGRLDDHERQSEIGLALCVAAMSFDASKNVRFATWAAFKIAKHLQTLNRTRKARPVTEWLDVEKVVDPHEDNPEAQDEIAWLFRALPQRDREIVRLFNQGWMLDEIGARVGLTKSSVSRRYHRALGVMRERVETAKGDHGPD